MKKQIRNNKKAFTIVELIVVMAVIGILVLLAAPKFKNYTQEARTTKLISNAKQIENASERYYVDKQDWPRLSDDAYTAEEVEEFAKQVFDSTGKVITLDPNGKYYDIDFDKLRKYVQEPNDGVNYILQNPVGDVFYLDGLTETGKTRSQSTQVTEETVTVSSGQVLEINNPYIKVQDASLFKKDSYALLYVNYGVSLAGTNEMIYIKSIDLENNLIYPETFPTKITSATNVTLHNVIYDKNQINVAKGSTITTEAFDGIDGGVLVLKTKVLNLEGTIDVSGKGYRGGTPITWYASHGRRGEGLNGGLDGIAEASYYGSGGCGYYPVFDDWRLGGSGGGGGNYTAGTSGYNRSNAGVAYSSYMTLSHDFALFGAGGGSGASDNDGSPIPGQPRYTTGAGGAGGGAVIIYADKIIGSGTILSKGEDGKVGSYQAGSGGSGAGGTIVIYTNNTDDLALNYNVSGGIASLMHGATTHSAGAGGKGVVYIVNNLTGEITTKN